MTKPSALDTYRQRLPMICDKIEALRQLADNHFGHARMTVTEAAAATFIRSIDPAS